MTGMNKLKTISLIVIVCAAALIAPSCKKQEKKPEEKPGAETQKDPAPEKTLDQILKDIPCKLEQKTGAFAVFAKNPVPGQWCFTLAAGAGDTTKPGTTFDIQSNDMLIVIHESRKVDPKSVQLMQWEQRNGGARLEKSRGKPVASENQSYTDPKNPGWFYLIMTPVEPLDLTTGTGGYYGIVMKIADQDTAYIPIFN